MDMILNDLIRELDTPNVTGILLTGSAARGEATPYSDLDLLVFVREIASAETYRLRYYGERLVSVSTVTVADKRAELDQPESAVWAVQGLRQARSLLDKEGEMRALQRSAADFRWEPLQAEANRYASRELMGLAEEAHKILSGLNRRDESTIVYGTLGMVLGLVRAVAVQRGVLFSSENAFFTQTIASVGEDSAWAKWLRLAAGLVDVPPGNWSQSFWRGRAALLLYQETFTLLGPILRPDDIWVIRKAVQTIRNAEHLISSTTK